MCLYTPSFGLFRNALVTFKFFRFIKLRIKLTLNEKLCFSCMLRMFRFVSCKPPLGFVRLHFCLFSEGKAITGQKSVLKSY